MQKDNKLYTILDAKAASGVGLGIEAGDFMHQMIQVFFNNFSGTIKFQGSLSESCPDFSAARSSSNQWEYIQVIDLQSGSNINGDTGVAATASTDVRLFELNLNAIKWMNIEVTRDGGSVSAITRLFNNQ